MVRFHAFSVFTGSQEPTPTQKQTSMKRISTFLFALLSACTFSAYAAIVDGTCGDNLTWTLNTKDSTLTISGTGAMANYESSTLVPWYDYKSYIKYITLPDGLTSIGGEAFSGCSSLTSITIPNSVTSIGWAAFEGCSDLTSVTLGNSITTIEYGTFSKCSSLTSVTLGNSVTSIGREAFRDCSSLTSITIPNSVTSIGDWAFYSCSGLTSVTIGNSVTSIGDNAFWCCSNLTSIEIPNSVTSIGVYAFYGCESLTSITIPESVTSIGDGAFGGCSGLTSITIPNSVTSIGDWAFYSCSSLTSITIPNSVTSIGNQAFKYCSSLTSVTIPNNVTSIGNQAFSGCSSLTSITIPNNVTSIGDWAFYSCYGLTSITIPNSVTSIGVYAFYGCESLTSITIPESVTSIGDGAFGECNNIQEVTSYAATPPAAASCGLNHTSCTLYVPAEYLEAYQNAVWWEDFKKIRAIGSDWDVEFVDWDGTILATMKVPNGEAATAPAAPTREGYTFIGWDKDFSSVIEDMTVTAQYQINRYQVRFYDWNDTLLKTDSVDYQSAATAPADPTRLGYTFIGWDKDFSSITADLDVHAQYEAGADKDLTVVYSDRDNNEISTQTLTFRIPLAPEIEGFTFLYWQPVAAPINDMITIQAVYEATTTAVPEVYVNPANPAQKLIRNGQVYILHEDKMYTISGQVVK